MANVTGYNLKNFYNGITKSQDPLYTYQFTAEFYGLDDSWGISDSSDPAKNISYYIQSANIPGITLKTGSVEYLGSKFNLPGVVSYEHSWNCTIFLEQNLTAYKRIQKMARKHFFIIQ